MARNFSRHPVGRTAKRQSLWLFLDFGEDTLASASSVLSASMNAAALALRPFTIVRTHIAIQTTSDQEAASERQSCAWGATVVTDQAVAVGASAIPTPGTDQASDWFAHQWMLGNSVNLTDKTVRGFNYQLDSKAMRKVDLGSNMIFVVENVAAAGVRIGTAGRILIKTN